MKGLLTSVPRGALPAPVKAPYSAAPVSSTGAALGGAVRAESTLCAGSWASPACARFASAPSAERIVPPLRSSVFSSTATPSVETFGSTTSCSNTSSAVPLPPA